MAGEAIWTYASLSEIVSAGSAPGNAAISASGGFTATASSTVTSTQHNNYPLADLVLTVAFSTAPTAGGTIDIFLREESVDGTNDTPQPDSNFLHQHVGQWLVDAVGSSTTQYLTTEIPIKREFSIWLRNNCDQATDTGWTVDIRAKTFGPGA